METLTPCTTDTLEQIDTQFVAIDYVLERNIYCIFGENLSTGTFWTIGRNITFLLLYSLIFFLGPT